MPLLLLCGRRAPAKLVWQEEEHQLCLPLQHMHSGFHGPSMVFFQYNFSFMGELCCPALSLLLFDSSSVLTQMYVLHQMQSSLQRCSNMFALHATCGIGTTLESELAYNLLTPCLCKLDSLWCLQQTRRWENKGGRGTPGGGGGEGMERGGTGEGGGV